MNVSSVALTAISDIKSYYRKSIDGSKLLEQVLLCSYIALRGEKFFKNVCRKKT